MSCPGWRILERDFPFFNASTTAWALGFRVHPSSWNQPYRIDSLRVANRGLEPGTTYLFWRYLTIVQNLKACNLRALSIFIHKSGTNQQVYFSGLLVCLPSSCSSSLLLDRGSYLKESWIVVTLRGRPWPLWATLASTRLLFPNCNTSTWLFTWNLSSDIGLKPILSRVCILLPASTCYMLACLGWWWSIELWLLKVR